ncbi:hypothetical protein ACS0TY_008868 [Phlomoides rotata]
MGVNVPIIKLGKQGLEVSQQGAGLGCMGMSYMYGPPEPDMINLIHHAINSGVTFLDTSESTGPTPMRFSSGSRCLKCVEEEEGYIERV